MKKLLLLTCVSAISVAATADVPQPKVFEDVFFSAMSPNGKYALSEGGGSVRIFNLETGHNDDFINEDGMASYGGGNGKCVSNNGIVVGTTDYINAEYFKDGEWYVLDAPEFAVATNVANAITPDGSRICGSIGVGDMGMAMDGDALMQVPCIWNASGDGYGMPVMLPYPEKDFTGRIPQYIMAIDISDDGKTIVGMVTSATGMINYPLIYKENEDGEWSYEIINENLLNPDNLVFPEWPGEGPDMPTQYQFMTEEELAEYQAAVDEWYASMGTISYPDINDYMSEEGFAAYTAAMDEYNKLYEVWYEKFLAWFEVHEACLDSSPGYLMNSVKISPDGKTIGCTVETVVENPNSWFPSYNYNVLMMDVATGAVTKYDQQPDINLTSLGNDGLALASTSVGSASDSFVIHDGKVEGMVDWMSEHCSGYATWMKENMVFDVIRMVYNPDTDDYEFVTEEMFMSGRAVGTPDLSCIALTVENTWDYETLGNGYIFDIKNYGGSGVESLRPVAGEEVIFDLSGRQLKEINAPGIYIVNGEKKVVR